MTGTGRVRADRRVRQTRFLYVREVRSLDQKGGVEQEEWRRRIRHGNRGGDCRGIPKHGDEHNIETRGRQRRKIQVRGGSECLTRTTVGGFVASVLGMILGMRGECTRVRVNRPGADVAYDHENGDDNEDD